MNILSEQQQKSVLILWAKNDLFTHMIMLNRTVMKWREVNILQPMMGMIAAEKECLDMVGESNQFTYRLGQGCM